METGHASQQNDKAKLDAMWGGGGLTVGYTVINIPAIHVYISSASDFQVSGWDGYDHVTHCNRGNVYVDLLTNKPKTGVRLASRRSSMQGNF